MSEVICMNCGLVIDTSTCHACQSPKAVEHFGRLFENSAMTMEEAVESFGKPGFKNPFSRSVLRAHASLRPSE